MIRDYCVPVLVCGGRDYGDEPLLRNYLDAMLFLYGDLMIMHGAARGADLMEERWAKDREQLYCGFPAQWLKYEKAAGMKRNAEMAALSGATQVVVFRGGRGTLNMLGLARNMDPAPTIHLPCGEFWK